MTIRFWGVRGSIATPLLNQELTAKIRAAIELFSISGMNHPDQIPAFINNLPWSIRETAGGNTACVEVQADDTLIILDAGTGLRNLGVDLIHRFQNRPFEAHIFLTHTHWDHICGIPFFEPSYYPDNAIFIYSPIRNIENRIRRLQQFDYFPVSTAEGYQFVQLSDSDTIQIGNVTVETMPMNHPGGSYGYRINYNGKSVVYATDSEYIDMSADALLPVINFFWDADMVIFDAQYTMLENIEKENWGHSNVFSGIDIAVEANVKSLYFIHHEPTYNDAKLEEILEKAKQYLKISQPESAMRVYLAIEGLTVNL